MSYEIFAEATLTGSATSIDLTEIPQTATHLELYINCRSIKTTTGTRGGGIRFNNISSNNYGIGGNYGEDSTTAAVWNRGMNTRDWIDDAVRHWNDIVDSNLFAPSKIVIPNYTSTTIEVKGAIIQNSAWGEDLSDFWIMQAMGHATVTGAAITQITIYPESGTSFKTGTSYYLAGWG
mgnify:CR=1 FL=1